MYPPSRQQKALYIEEFMCNSKELQNSKANKDIIWLIRNSRMNMASKNLLSRKFEMEQDCTMSFKTSPTSTSL
jgi:hypothetical protein